MEKYWSLTDYAQERKKTGDDGQEFTVRFLYSKSVILKAAENLVDQFAAMEASATALLPVDPETFYFNMENGSLRFAGQKNLAGMTKTVNKKDLMQMFTAPELILSEEEQVTATQESQNWALAVLLFMLFFHTDNPFMGKESTSQIFLSPEQEYIWYAQNAVFSMDPDIPDNRPVHGLQRQLLRYWDEFPKSLQQAFQRVFGDGKLEPEKRLSPREWKIALNQAWTDYIECKCGARGFINLFRKNENGTYSCPRCQQTYYPFTSGENHVYLNAGSKIRRNQITPELLEDTSVIAEVVENKQKKGLFGIKNLSGETWKGLYPSGEVRDLAPGGGVPLWSGLEITMENGDIWKIKGE